MKEEVIKLVSKQIKLKSEEIDKLIEIPSNPEMGDYAFPCFILAKTLKKNPVNIAEDLAKTIKPKAPIESIEAKGPYLNFFINKKEFTKEAIKNAGKIEKISKEKIIIEFPSPNTNKPLHLGHLRNMSLGESVARILESKGNKVIRTNLNNDRGVHICQSMLVYKELSKIKTPNKKSDHFVGDLYVLFNKKAKKNEKLKEKAQEMLQKWEAGDKETIALWKKMNKWAIDGFKETYKTFGIKPDENYNESEIYTKGKEIIDKGLKKGIFEKRKDGAIIINLEKEGLGEKVVLRSDGTSVYITQDLYLAELKNKKYNPDKSIYVVANEQDYHFKVLFSIIKKLGLKSANSLYHLSYGLVNLPEGRMKSREGTVVDADDLIKETQELVKANLKEKSEKKLSEKELEDRSLKISLGAIKYFLLKIEAVKGTIFNPKESLSFEGDTGPYLQYSYARASSILRKSKKKPELKIKKIQDSEFKLIKKISELEEVVDRSIKQLNPSFIAHYAYQLSQTFNEFYHANKVIGTDEEEFRLKLIDAFRTTLKQSLSLLGIDVLEEM